MDQHSVLLIDDQVQQIAAIKARLEAEGFRVFATSNGLEAAEVISSLGPAVILVEPHLSGLDGLALLRRVRDRCEAPILAVSTRADEADVVLVLEAGADDFLPKPCRLNELVARVRAALRRPRLAAAAPAAGDGTELNVGKIRVCQRSHAVYVDGKPVDLTPTEYRMLVFLMTHPGRVVSRDAILQAVWGYNGYDESLINTHIKRLRAKLEDNPESPELIVTVRGFGYKLATQPLAA